MSSCRRQVIECKTGQLLQQGSFPAPPGPYAHPYHSIAALPAGRIAAAEFEGINVLSLEMAGAELAPAGDGCQPRPVRKTALLDRYDLGECATRLGDAGLDR